MPTRRVSYQLETLWDYLMPRLLRLGLISERIAPRYREIGLPPRIGVAKDFVSIWRPWLGR